MTVGTVRRGACLSCTIATQRHFGAVCKRRYIRSIRLGLLGSVCGGNNLRWLHHSRRYCVAQSYYLA